MSMLLKRNMEVETDAKVSEEYTSPSAALNSDGHHRKTTSLPLNLSHVHTQAASESKSIMA